MLCWDVGWVFSLVIFDLVSKKYGTIQSPTAGGNIVSNLRKIETEKGYIKYEK